MILWSEIVLNPAMIFVLFLAKWICLYITYVRYDSHLAQTKKAHKCFEASCNGLVLIVTVTDFKLEFLAPLQSSTFPLFFLPICMGLNRCQMFTQDSGAPSRPIWLLTKGALIKTCLHCRNSYGTYPFFGYKIFFTRIFLVFVFH